MRSPTSLDPAGVAAADVCTATSSPTPAFGVPGTRSSGKSKFSRSTWQKTAERKNKNWIGEGVKKHCYKSQNEY